MSESLSFGGDLINECLIIIDSDAVFVSRMLSLFEDQYQCYVAHSGEEGLDLFGRLSGTKRLFILCGSNLSDISVFDVCALIKKEEPQTYCTLFFQESDFEKRMKGLAAGADNCLSKQIVDEELELWVSNILQTRSSTRVLSNNELPSRNGDEIFSALEAEVRSLIESYYQLSSKERQTEECSSNSTAQHLGLSQRSFQRVMKSETGYTFKQLQLIVRLEKAQQLLAEGYNVNQVTDLLSFSSPAHFSSAFKDEFGIRPSKYRLLV